ncbi:MAG: c-type cytochrome [Rubrivivax sp.]
MTVRPFVRWLLLLALGFATLAVRAAQPAAGAQPAVLYHNYCSVCHGDKGDGRSRAAGSFATPVRDFTSEASKKELSRERIVLAITHGRPGTAMVSWKSQLSETDIRRLADHVYDTYVHPSPALAGRGKDLYDKNCAVCHGDKGAGSVWANQNMARPPRNFAAPESATLTREAMIAAATQGKPGTPMAGFGGRLPPEDIATVVDYIRSAFMAAAPISGTRAHGGREADAGSTSVRVDMTAGLPNGLKGDLKRGGAFYMANCATCHGSRGDGQGPRAYFINPKPRNFVEDASRARLNRVALYAAVQEGRLATEMPAWKHVATPQQMADVAEFVFQTFIQGKAATVAAEGRR